VRILYLVEWDAYHNSGVLRKVLTQFSIWRSLGADAHMLIVSPRPKVAAEPLAKGVQLTVVDHQGGPLTKLHKAFALRDALEIVSSIDPTVIYFRQSSWTPGLISVLSCARITVAEINSNEAAELAGGGWITSVYGKLTRKRIIEHVSGFVCVSDELAELSKAYGRPAIAIGNGFDLSSVSPRIPPRNPRPRLVFVGTPGQSWHGVDKVLELATELPEMDFDVVGDVFLHSLSNVTMHGSLSWAELDMLYQKVDVGIGTLALHRKSMNQATPLKTREYLAYGIPVLGAYRDPDLLDCPFYLQLPNTPECATCSIALVRNFVSLWKGQTIDREMVRERIGADVKERARLKFLAQLSDVLSPGHED
jgi:hypothetical protein